MLQTKNQLKWPPILIVSLSLIVAGATFLLPTPGVSDTEWVAIHVRTALALMLGVLFVGAAIWFMAGLSRFRTALRRAYIKFGVGLIFFSVSVMQLPLLYLFYQWELVPAAYETYSSYGGVVLPFIISSLFIYWGVRKQGQLVGVSSRLHSVWVATGLALLTGIAAGVGVYLAIMIGIVVLKSYVLTGMVYFFILTGLVLGFSLVTLALTVKTHRIIGEAYKPYLQWQKFSLMAFAVSGAIQLLGTALFDGYHVYQYNGYYMWPFILTGLVLLRACYDFHLLTNKDRASLVSISQVETRDQDYIDTLVSLAGLASRPQDITAIMDGLREVTVTMDSDGGLTEKQRTRLMHVYGELETYLMAKDPLRTFTREELRDHATPGFRNLLLRAEGATAGAPGA